MAPWTAGGLRYEKKKVPKTQTKSAVTGSKASQNSKETNKFSSLVLQNYSKIPKTDKISSNSKSLQNYSKM